MDFLKFKDTQIRKIPKEWEVVRLSDVGELEYGYTCAATVRNTGIKFLRITDIKDDGRVKWEGVPYCDVNRNNYEKYKLASGDILFARIGATTGKTAFVDREIKGVFASYLIKFRPSLKDLETKFLYYVTQSNTYWIQVHKNKEGQLKKGLNAKVLGNIEFLLPPFPEQKKIAEVLSTVDQAIEKVGEAIKKTQRLRKGLLQELLTKGIGHKEFKKTVIGKMPRDWDVKKLADIGNLQYGYTASAIKQSDGIHFVRITDINDNGKIKWKSVPTCKIDKREYEKYRLNKGDVLFARIGATTGKSALIDKEIKGVFASYLIRFVRKIRSLDSKYLYFFTQSNGYWLQVHRNKEGQLKKGINAKILGSLCIPLPPRLEQQKIAGILDSIDERLESLWTRKQGLDKIKKGLMEDLLTGRKRVKLEA